MIYSLALIISINITRIVISFLAFYSNILLNSNFYFCSNIIDLFYKFGYNFNR